MIVVVGMETTTALTTTAPTIVEATGAGMTTNLGVLTVTKEGVTVDATVDAMADATVDAMVDAIAVMIGEIGMGVMTAVVMIAVVAMIAVVEIRTTV